MAIIIPAILEKDTQSFLDKIALISKVPELERIQVDFADGRFVSNTLLPVTEIDPLNPAYTWEAHLMVEEPVDFLDYQIAGFNILIVHFEAFTDPSTIPLALAQIKSQGMKAGIAINPKTPVSVLLDFKDLADQFLLLGVEPGFQGRPFVPETIERMRELRQLIPHGILEVDGAVKQENIGSLASAGADLLVVGSALVGSVNIQENYDMLTKGLLQSS